MMTISNTEDMLDVRDIMARVEELEESLSSAKVEDNFHTNEDREELATLNALRNALKGNSGDEQWRDAWYPVTLIRANYFTDYARELIVDCGHISHDFPSWIEIDWKETAENVKQDYSSVDYDGVDYWYR
jgi:hypothetical protein